MPDLSAQPLADSLTAYLRRLPAGACVSIAFESLVDSNVAFSHRADARVPSASVIKLPILLEAMERVKAGTFDPEAVHTLLDAEKTGGDGVLKTYPAQSRIRYVDLLRLMIRHSDNTATNLLIDKLGMDAINQRMQRTGLTNSRLNRRMMDTLAARQGRDNYVTCRDMNTLLKKIYRHEVATPVLCEQMLTMLKETDDTKTIPRLLPNGTVVAHKTGILAYVRGDAGIVYRTDGPAPKPFLLTVFVEGVSTSEAEQIIGDIALRCFRHQ